MKITLRYETERIPLTEADSLVTHSINATITDLYRSYSQNFSIDPDGSLQSTILACELAAQGALDGIVRP